MIESPAKESDTDTEVIAKLMKHLHETNPSNIKQITKIVHPMSNVIFVKHDFVM